jgi:hypothetical protein
MNGLLLVLLGFRFVFLLGAAGLCLYGVAFMGAPALWRLGFAVGFAIALGMIWALWRSYRALRKG